MERSGPSGGPTRCGARQLRDYLQHPSGDTPPFGRSNLRRTRPDAAVPRAYRDAKTRRSLGFNAWKTSNVAAPSSPESVPKHGTMRTGRAPPLACLPNQPFTTKTRRRSRKSRARRCAGGRATRTLSLSRAFLGRETGALDSPSGSKTFQKTFMRLSLVPIVVLQSSLTARNKLAPRDESESAVFCGGGASGKVDLSAVLHVVISIQLFVQAWPCACRLALDVCDVARARSDGRHGRIPFPVHHVRHTSAQSSLPFFPSERRLRERDEPCRRGEG